MQLLTWLHVSDYRDFWKTERWKSGNNSSALNNCFSYRNVFQNGVNALSKCVCVCVFFFFLSFFFFLNPGCLLKRPKLRVVWTVRFCSNFISRWSKYLSNNVWRDFRLPMSALATVAGKSFNGKFTPKIDIPLGYFILPLLMLTLEV